MRSVVLGRPHVVRLCVVALLAGEHVLLEDVPGVGKTLIAKALARSVAGSFCRVQFTPDLLPSDILGGNIFNSQTGQFVYQQGPIFANIVLADEINRSSPRTQSAMLEAMSDRQVSTDGVTHPLPRPFMVIATQNPFEFEGTYPLPESQLDRFLLRTKIGYPDREDERRVLTSHQQGEPVDQLAPVVDCDQVLRLQQAARDVRVDDAIHDFVLDIAAATRNSDEFLAGISTRATLALCRACQGLALVEGRDFVTPDDVKRLAVPVLAHRVISKGFLHSGSSESAEKQIERLVDEVPVPN